MTNRLSEITKYIKGLGGSIAIENLFTDNWVSWDLENKNLGELEHIVDYLIYKQFEDLSWASYDLLKSKSVKWTEQLSRNVIRIDEEEGVDFKTVLDFEDGFRFVRLMSEKAYQREGALMSHCVASYYSRDVEIFSLRDSFNKPHCTIEKDTQIKGKGNGSISLKYIDYVVRFLEWTGMEVRDSEMENLGYIVEPFGEYLKDRSNLFRGKYIPKSLEPEYVDTVIVFEDLNKACNYKGSKKVLLRGNAYFGDSKVTDLGNLKSIGGNADFGDSKVTDLGNLKSIGGYADFGDSKVTDLGNLKSIGGSAYFGNSKVTDLGNLENIGGSAYFGDSKVTDLGNLKSIGGNADFGDSKVTDLGNLKSIGGYADFGDSKVTDLGNLKSIGGYADFGDSKVTDLGNLKSIGGSADFGNSKVTDLGNLENIGGSAYFGNSKVIDLGNLKSIGGYAFFGKGQEKLKDQYRNLTNRNK